jgi:outer membrane protein assembly factor BamB
MVIIGERLYVLTSQNFLVSLDRKNGEPVFSREIGERGFPVFGLNSYGGELYSVVGNKLTQINEQSGETISEINFDYGVVCPASRNKDFFYVGGSDKCVHTLKAENKVEVFKAAAGNGSAITAVMADEDFVVFSTDAGDVICMTIAKPQKMWSFRAAGAILAPLVKDADDLYFASKDTNIYCINLKDGDLKWKYPSGMMPAKAPIITPAYLYENAAEKGVFALDKTGGKFAWQIEDATGLLAESAGKDYLMTTRLGRTALLVVDSKSGKRINSLNLAGITSFASNAGDSYIYIADETGRVACIKPVVRSYTSSAEGVRAR